MILPVPGILDIPVFRHVARGTAYALLALLCAACSRPEGKASSQVGLKVNGEEVSVHQVDLALQRGGSAAPSAVLAALVDQELAAQAARKQRLDRDPRVVQMLEAAKREVLAQASLDRMTERIPEPSSDEIDAYYRAHPELFSERRLYSLQETMVTLPAAGFDALKARLQSASHADQVVDVLRAGDFPFTVRQLSVSAEDVPLIVLNQLAALREGQSLVLPRTGGARVLTLLRAQVSPVARTAASRLIAAYLINERRALALQQGMKALREPASIEYAARYAPMAASAASSAGAAASSR